MHQNSSYYRLVNLVVPGIAGGNTGTDFTFNDQPDIRYARTTGLFTLFANDLSYTQPDGVPVVGDIYAPKITFVFETNDPDDPEMIIDGKKTKQKGSAGRFTGTLDTIQWLPATSIHLTQSFGTSPAPFVRHMLHWKDRYIVWQKSHVKLAPGGLGNTTDVAIVLGVLYSFIDEFGKPIYPRN